MFVLLFQLNQNEVPKYFCYECAALLKKFNMFRQKTLKGQAVLQGILQTYGKVCLVIVLITVYFV